MESNEDLLHKALHDRVDSTELDVDRLIEVANHHGTRLRRRRTATISLAAAACIGVIAGGGVALNAIGGSDPAPDSSVATGGDHASPTGAPDPKLTEPDEPLTPDSVVMRTRPLTAAAIEQVTSVVPGATAGYAGQDDHFILDYVPVDQASANGGFDLTPDATGDAGRVFVGYQPQAPGPKLFTCAAQGGKYTDDVSSCSVTKGDDGSVVVTFEEQVAQTDGTTLLIRTADARRSDGSRVTIQSSNTDEPSDSKKGQQVFSVNGKPGLSLAQMRGLAGWDGWDVSITSEYAEAGKALKPFDDFSQKN